MSAAPRRPTARDDLGPRARALLARFERERGFTREWHRSLARYDPEFFDRYIGWSSHMYRRGALPLKVKELILMALDAACTHQHADGTRVHMRNALRNGASPAEVVEALELATLIGIHSCSLGLPILAEVLGSGGGATAGRGAGGERPRGGRGARRPAPAARAKRSTGNAASSGGARGTRL